MWHSTTFSGPTPTSSSTRSSTSCARRCHPGRCTWSATCGCSRWARAAARSDAASPAVNDGETPISPMMPGRTPVPPIPSASSATIADAWASTAAAAMRSPSNFSRYAPQPATTCSPVRRATSARRSGLRPIAALDVASTIVRPPRAAKLELRRDRGDRLVGDVVRAAVRVLAQRPGDRRGDRRLDDRLGEAVARRVEHPGQVVEEVLVGSVRPRSAAAARPVTVWT